jgi:hypothetical protein
VKLNFRECQIRKDLRLNWNPSPLDLMDIMYLSENNLLSVFLGGFTAKKKHSKEIIFG